jgi:2-polyprenyl-3-methyl-5-hydroxy-6-metoxy-1,4-benzoquinol methylase
MTLSAQSQLLPSREELYDLFVRKYGKPEDTGWSPRRRFRSGYFLPSDVYEAVVNKLVTKGCSWLDVGGGRSPFPENYALARSLAERVHIFVGVDPSAEIDVNPFVHRGIRARIEDFTTTDRFDIVTMRMVAEHVMDPRGFVAAIARLLHPKGKAVVLTVNWWSPITLISRITPFALHHPIKRLLWGGREEDTFPVAYRMNTRRRLQHIFGAAGLIEKQFSYVDDCSAFGQFYYLNGLELSMQRFMRQRGWRYPETCLLGIYEKA